MDHSIPLGQMALTPLDFTLEPGLLFRAGATVFQLTSIHDDIAIVRHAVSMQERKVLVPNLLADFSKGKITLADSSHERRALQGDIFENDDEIRARLPLDGLTEAQMKQVLRLVRYIRGLRSLGYSSLVPKNPTIQLDIDRLQRRFNDPKPAKAAWIYQWSLRFDHASGDPRSLIPRFTDRGGSKKPRIASEIDQAIKNVLDRKKAETNAPVRPYKIVQEVESNLQIEYPNRPDLTIGSVCWSTVKRYIEDTFSPYELCRRHHGKAFADRKYRDWYPRDTAETPLLIWETDDTDTCIFTVDEISGLPSGRAFLTSVIDQCTQIVPGLEISHRPRSTWSAVSAIIKGILPKDPMDPDLAEIRSGCEFYGKPGVIVFDNALYNHATEIEQAAISIGFIPGWAKPKTPTEKAEQEGWNGRVKEKFMSTLPGYRGDKKLRDGLQAGMASANLGLQEFKQLLMKWIYDDYSSTPMADGLTPRQKWHLGMRNSKPRIPRDIWGYRLAPCLHKTLKFRPEGILFCGLIYSAPFLHALRKRYGHNADANFRFNPGNLKEIYLQDPKTKAYVPIPCTNPEYASGLSLYQHQLVLKMARENRIRNPSIPQLLLLREELRILTEQLRYSTKLRDRKRSVRTGTVPDNASTSTPVTSAASDAIVVTDLENRILELEEVEMEEEEEGWNLAEVA